MVLGPRALEEMAINRAPFGGAFAGRRVLVTGHTGFKGSWLCLWLHELGARVVGYALPPDTKPSLYTALGLDRLIESHLGDVRDFERLSGIMRRAKPEIIFHLAAQPIVRLSYSLPVETFAVNLQGTVHLLEAVRQTRSARVCLVVTTDKCYENRAGRLLTEADRLGGHDPYSASKACAELAVSSYRDSFFAPAQFGRHKLSLSSARAGNVIGGGDWAGDRLLPDCMRAWARGAAALVRNPRSVRPWQHALDPLAGYLHLARCQLRRPKAHAEAWNFGPAAAAGVPAAEIVRIAAAAWGKGLWHTPPHRSQSRLREAPALRLDSGKARRRLGWRPVYGTAQAVAETVRWYRGFYRERGFDALAFSRSQIQDFLKAGRERTWLW